MTAGLEHETTRVDYATLLPPETNRNKSFWEGCVAGEVRLQRCDDCGHWRFPDASLCPRCWSPRATWTKASGRGTLWSWIVMHRQYLPAYPVPPPYPVGIVELEEGPLLASGLDAARDDPHIGMPLWARFDTVNGDRTILSFSTVRPGVAADG